MIACLDLVPWLSAALSADTLASGRPPHADGQGRSRPPLALASRPAEYSDQSTMRYPPWRARDQPGCSSPVAKSTRVRRGGQEA